MEYVINSSVINKEECREMVEKFFGSDQFSLENYSLEPWSQQRGGFTGNHVRICINLLPKHESICHYITFFMKVLSTNTDDKLTEMINLTNAYDKEINLYSKVFEEMKRVSTEILSKKNKKYISWSPISVLIKPNLIVMEDLSRLGFKTLPLRTDMPLDHCRIIIQALARMHADSIVYEEYGGSKGLILEKYQDILSELFVNEEGTPGKNFVQASIKSMTNLMEKFVCQSVDENVKKMFVSTLEKIFELSKPSNRYRNVLCHGDMWSTNLLFKYDEQSGHPIEAMLVDYQLTRYTPPAHDIMCFLFLTMSKDLRQKHLENLTQYYYMCLSEILTERGLDPENVFPKSDFEESCIEYSLIGKITAVLYFNVIYFLGSPFQNRIKNSDELGDYVFHEREPNVSFFMNNDPCFKKKNCEAIEELMDYCKEILNKPL